MTRFRVSGSSAEFRFRSWSSSRPTARPSAPCCATCASCGARTPATSSRSSSPSTSWSHWWQNLLHNQTALRLKARLLFEPSVTVTSVPWVLESEQGAPATEASRHVRAEDLLDEPAPASRSPSRGLARRRQFTGLVFAVVALPLLTLLLDSAGEHPVARGPGAALPARGGRDRRRGRDGRRGRVRGRRGAADQLLLRRAGAHARHRPGRSGARARGVRRRRGVGERCRRDGGGRARAAEQARAEAETLSALAGAELEESETLHGVLERARKTFRMESVALKVRQRGRGDWIDAEQAGWAPRERRRRCASTCRSGRTCGWWVAGRRSSPRTSGSCRPSLRPPRPRTRAGG